MPVDLTFMVMIKRPEAGGTPAFKLISQEPARHIAHKPTNWSRPFCQKQATHAHPTKGR